MALPDELRESVRDAVMDTFREWGGQWNVSPGYSGSIRDRSSERRWVRTSSTRTWRIRRIPERCPPGRRSSGQPLRKRRRRRPRRAVAQHVQPAATFCMYRL